MFLSTYLIGFLGGLTAVVFRPAVDALAKKYFMRINEDEKHLLCLARAAGGRLIFRPDHSGVGPPALRLKEFPNHKTLENKGQIERLLVCELIVPDGSGLPGRFLMTPAGWTRIKKVPPLPLTPTRQGTWFNSSALSANRNHTPHR